MCYWQSTVGQACTRRGTNSVGNCQELKTDSMAKTLQNLLGDSVIGASGESVPVSSLCGKDRVLGVYFSAHWCPPCRGFTPKLVEFYKNWKQNDKGVNFEIVFVSWDRDEASFKEYLETMPWLALPYEVDGKVTKGKLCKKFRIQGIPKLVLIDAETGQTINCDGYSCLMEDENGAEFPWRRKKFTDIIKGKLLKQMEEVDALEELRGKTVGVYFSAHWCPPCRGFTPELMYTYEKLKSEGKKFEVVFVSSDRSQESFDKYYETMPWLSIPFGDVARSQLLKNYFGVDGIPTLVLVDETGNVITLDGRVAVNEDRDGQEFPWHPKPLNELTEGAAIQLNESACLVLFVEPDDDEVDRAKEILMEPAKEEHEKGEHQDLFFFIAADEEICDPVRQFANLGMDVPLLAILDFPEQKVYISEEKDITTEIVKQFVKGYFDETLPSRPCRPT